MLIAARNAILAGGAALPYDAEVEYLESTGTQLINTGIAPNSATTRIAGRIYLGTGSGSVAVFGSRVAYNNKAYLLFGYMSDPTYNYKLRFDFGNTNKHSASLGVGWWNIDISGNILTVSNETYSQSVVADLASASNTVPMFLFSVSTSGSPWAAPVGNGIRCSQFSIWESNVLVRDFIPVRFTNELGVSEGAMYDRVSGQLFGNAGTGAFTIGPDIS